jgi:hypothetical protein
MAITLENIEQKTIKIEKYSVGSKNKKPILNDIIYTFCNLKKAIIHIILRKVSKLEFLPGGRWNALCNSDLQLAVVSVNASIIAQFTNLDSFISRTADQLSAIGRKVHSVNPIFVTMKHIQLFFSDTVPKLQ